MSGTTSTSAPSSPLSLISEAIGAYTSIATAQEKAKFQLAAQQQAAVTAAVQHQQQTGASPAQPNTQGASSTPSGGGFSLGGVTLTKTEMEVGALVVLVGALFYLHGRK